MAAFLQDLLTQLAGTVSIFYADRPSRFMSAAALGAFLAVACCLACVFYTKLWNLKYRVGRGHLMLCGAAAILTFVFAILYPALDYMKETSEARIESWRTSLKADADWESAVFKMQYDAVKKLGIEDFSGYPPPERGGHIIPNKDPRSQSRVAQIVANEAANHFNAHHPFLGMILHAGVANPQKAIETDMKKFFETGASVYEEPKAIDLAANDIRDDLAAQTPRVVTVSRWIILTLFAVIQAALFALIGVAAYKDLKVTL